MSKKEVEFEDRFGGNSGVAYRSYTDGTCEVIAYCPECQKEEPTYPKTDGKEKNIEVFYRPKAGGLLCNACYENFLNTERINNGGKREAIGKEHKNETTSGSREES